MYTHSLCWWGKRNKLGGLLGFSDQEKKISLLSFPLKGLMKPGRARDLPHFQTQVPNDDLGKGLQNRLLKIQLLLVFRLSPQQTIRSAGFTPLALPDATLAVYPGLGAALHPVVGVWPLAGNRTQAFRMARETLTVPLSQQCPFTQNTEDLKKKICYSSMTSRKKRPGNRFPVKISMLNDIPTYYVKKIIKKNK